ncbi:MAG: AraC family transcriptional regulator [Lachnospiraceae bacterium]|nr:AraC family transcriptional regulator [Lachnospiraceae bacterium]
MSQTQTDHSALPKTIRAHAEYSESPDQSVFQMHSHIDYEIYFFQRGEAFYTVEGTRYDLHPGDLLLMCPGEVHHVTFRSKNPYRRIIVNFHDLDPLPEELQKRLLRPFHERPFGQFNQYPSDLFPNSHFQFYLEQLCSAKDPVAGFTLLLPLLQELNLAFSVICTLPKRQESHEASQVLNYLSDHLTEPLSLSDLCERFYLSKSRLNRIFKDTTGATVWAYVTTKRLFLARDLILKGVQPTIAAEECGFGDYSTFFRAYKKKFGVSPKQNRNPRRDS